MSARHTPGPYEDHFEDRTIIVGDVATHTDLAEFFWSGEHTVSTSREEAEATARLFMAAPDLLAALELIVSVVAASSPNLHVLKIARAAIERATQALESDYQSGGL